MAGAGRLLKDSDKIVFGEFWTAKQRQGHPIHHTVSYRASFKPELPSFFMKEFLKRKTESYMIRLVVEGLLRFKLILKGMWQYIMTSILCLFFLRVLGNTYLNSKI